jgi:nitrogenase molybdenum-iron protein alpha chain
VPCKQLHSYDYSGPYAAFTGAANFYREVDRLLTSKVWKFITPPWEKDPQSVTPLAHASKSERREAAKAWRKPAAGGPDDPV